MPKACYTLSMMPALAHGKEAYRGDVADDEWAFVTPYLTRLREDAFPRACPLRELFNGLRWIVRTGSPWRYLPHDFPPWQAVYPQARRRMKLYIFLQIAGDLRRLLGEFGGREPGPTAALLDRRTLCSTSAPRSRGDRGALAGATVTSRSTAANSTWRWIPWATGWC